MALVVKHARAIKCGSWLMVAVLTLVTFLGLVHQYLVQYELILEGQKALLATRSSAGFAILERQLSTHQLQGDLVRADPPPESCLPASYIATKQRIAEVRSKDVNDISQRVLLRTVAVQPGVLGPASPRATILNGKLRLVSRVMLGYSCLSHAAVLWQTQTLLTSLIMAELPVLNKWAEHDVVLHVSLTQGLSPTLYYDIHLGGGEAVFRPAKAGSWSVPAAGEKPAADRYLSTRTDPEHALSVTYYSEPLVPHYPALFLQLNDFELVLAACLIITLMLVGWLVLHLVDLSVQHHNDATHDFLTGLYNRRAAVALATTELARSARGARPVCAMQLDIDHFKRVNDTHGHDAGDQVLAFFAAQLRQGLRQYDLCARTGGEEFLVLLPETDLTGAQTLAERLLRSLRGARMDYAGYSIGVTCSIGVTAWQGAAESLETLLTRADQLLYQAKQQGRDRYVSDAAVPPEAVLRR